MAISLVKKTTVGICLAVAVACNSTQAAPISISQDYHLQKVVILSRHNLRTPLVSNNGLLQSLTPHEWVAWTAAPGELTVKGEMLEKTMGVYFHQYLLANRMLSSEKQIKNEEIYFYANSLQRTIMTAKCFASTAFPNFNIPIEYKYAVNESDPVFSGELTRTGNNYYRLVAKEIEQARDGKGISGMEADLREDITKLEEALDFQKSPKALAGETDYFKKDSLKLCLGLEKWISLGDELRRASRVSDALKLQYYEEPDNVKAGFGQSLSWEQWEKIADINEIMQDVMMASPALTVNMAHPMLKVLKEELCRPERKFSFIAGHDTNIATVLPALKVVPFALPNVIAKKSPIGAKIVIEKWLGKDGEEYATVSMVYASLDQMRNLESLSLANPPMKYYLDFRGLVKNKDGLYAYEDIVKRFQDAIDAYNNLPKN